VQIHVYVKFAVTLTNMSFLSTLVLCLVGTVL